jgi:hypothetical protein
MTGIHGLLQITNLNSHLFSLDVELSKFILDHLHRGGYIKFLRTINFRIILCYIILTRE